MILGFYRHKKGGLYLALFIAKLEATKEPHVIYLGWSGLWARPAVEFLQPERFRRVTFR